jgi:hypothetical protein
MNERQEPKVLRQVVSQGRCTGPNDVRFGVSEQGNEQMGLVFEVTKGDYEGRRLPWYGTLASDEALALVKETLVNAGWDGGSLTELKGLGDRIVSLAIDVVEIVGRDGTLREIPKLRFVNRLAQATMKNAIEGDAKAALTKRLEQRMKKLENGGGRSTGARAHHDASSPEAARADFDEAGF